MPKRGAVKNYVVKQYSAEQQKALLTNFVRLDRSQWSLIQVGEYVRYVGTDNELRLGGIVRVPAFKLDGKGKSEGGADPNTVYMRIESRDKFGRVSNWVVKHDNIQDLYIAMPSTQALMASAIEENLKILHEDLAKAVLALQKVVSRVAALEAKVPRA